MLNPFSHGSNQIDPNTQRLLEQLAFVVNDTEQRLVAIKTALSQVLAPLTQGVPPQGIVTGMGFGATPSSAFQGVPAGLGVSPGTLGFGAPFALQPPGVPQGAVGHPLLAQMLGIPPQTGVIGQGQGAAPSFFPNTPTGIPQGVIGSPYGTPFGSPANWPTAPTAAHGVNPFVPGVNAPFGTTQTGAPFGNFRFG